MITREGKVTALISFFNILLFTDYKKIQFNRIFISLTLSIGLVSVNSPFVKPQNSVLSQKSGNRDNAEQMTGQSQSSG